MGRILGLMCAGALIAVVLTTWLAPSVFVWWFTPPGGAQGLTVAFDAPKAIRWGMNRLVHAQVISILVGALLGLIVAVLFRRKAATPPPREAVPTTPQKTTT